MVACRATIAELRGMPWVQQGYSPARGLSPRVSQDSDGSDDHIFDDTVEPQYLVEVRRWMAACLKSKQGCSPQQF